MTSKNVLYGLVSMIAVVVLSLVFFATGSVLAEEVDGEQITEDVFQELCENGLPPMFGCEEDTPDDDNENLPVDPCTDIFPEIPGLQCEDDSEEDPVVDVCPDMDGVQTSTDECPGNGGGGGGTLPACSDTLDNDNDGQTDLSDSDCSDAQDNDESTPSSGGGGGGGGGGYFAPATTTATTTGEVLSATTTVALPESCDAYLTAFIKPDGDNDADQVMRLQDVLKKFEGHEIEVTGVYDEPTISAVHDFETKYASEILAPWGIAQSTGFVYLTTRKKVNEVFCSREAGFPLSNEEQKVIDAVHHVAPLIDVEVAEEPEQVIELPKNEVEKKTAPKVEAETTSEGGAWARISDFLQRFLNRAR